MINYLLGRVQCVAKEVYPHGININCEQFTNISTIILFYVISVLIYQGKLNQVKGKGICYNTEKFINNSCN